MFLPRRYSFLQCVTSSLNLRLHFKGGLSSLLIWSLLSILLVHTDGEAYWKGNCSAEWFRHFECLVKSVFNEFYEWGVRWSVSSRFFSCGFLMGSDKALSWGIFLYIILWVYLHVFPLNGEWQQLLCIVVVSCCLVLHILRYVFPLNGEWQQLYSILLLFIVVYLIVMTQCNIGVRTVLYAVRVVM